jgi:hypothetical protein
VSNIFLYRSENEHKLWWKVSYVNDGSGSLSATVQTNTNDNEEQQPITTSSIINVYFLGENGLLSAVDFDLTCPGYRISLLKKKILCGMFLEIKVERNNLFDFQVNINPNQINVNQYIYFNDQAYYHHLLFNSIPV